MLFIEKFDANSTGSTQIVFQTLTLQWPRIAQLNGLKTLYKLHTVLAAQVRVILILWIGYWCVLQSSYTNSVTKYV